MKRKHSPHPTLIYPGNEKIMKLADQMENKIDKNAQSWLIFGKIFCVVVQLFLTLGSSNRIQLD